MSENGTGESQISASGEALHRVATHDEEMGRTYEQREVTREALIAANQEATDAHVVYNAKKADRIEMVQSAAQEVSLDAARGDFTTAQVVDVARWCAQQLDDTDFDIRHEPVERIAEKLVPGAYVSLDSAQVVGRVTEVKDQPVARPVVDVEEIDSNRSRVRVSLATHLTYPDGTIGEERLQANTRQLLVGDGETINKQMRDIINNGGHNAMELWTLGNNFAFLDDEDATKYCYETAKRKAVDDLNHYLERENRGSERVSLVKFIRERDPEMFSGIYDKYALECAEIGLFNSLRAKRFLQAYTDVIRPSDEDSNQARFETQTAIDFQLRGMKLLEEKELEHSQRAN